MRCRRNRSSLNRQKLLLVNRMNLEDQKGGKNRVIINTQEMLDGMNRRPSSSVHHALTWRRRTPTARAERTMSAAGMRTASEKLRQLSASSPASSRASGGARVLTEVERWAKDFFTAGDKYL